MYFAIGLCRNDQSWHYILNQKYEEEHKVIFNQNYSYVYKHCGAAMVNRSNLLTWVSAVKAVGNVQSFLEYGRFKCPSNVSVSFSSAHID